MARNSTLSFRNNARHDYLLRCLLSCGTCGLAMFGVTQRDGTGKPQYRYYKCHGKDCVMRDRDRPCPRRPVKADELEAAVWAHIEQLLNDPETLLKQFEALAGQADAQKATEGEEESKAQLQLRRFDREERRLLDAYQAEAIELTELKDRRQQIDARRQALATQHEQQARLRSEWQTAREVWADLKAFCERVRSRLAEASPSEKQQVLQLLVERVIVGEDTLEIRHVIPLRRRDPEAVPSVPDGPPEGSGPAGSGPEEGSERLCSDGVGPAPLQPSKRPVHPRTVAVDDARIILSQPIHKNIGSTRGPASEQREGRRHKGPDPTLGFAFLGRRLIDVQNGLLRQLANQLVIGRLHRLGGPFLQRHHPAGTGRLIENHTQEQGSPPLGLAEAGHEQAAESDQSRSSLAGRDTSGQRSAGDGATATSQAMALVFADAGFDFG